MSKPRVQLDVSLLILLIFVTVLVFSFPQLYKGYTPTVDNSLDCLGFIIVLKGAVIRMAARGHKKSFSANSNSLVTTGSYALVRNPMYLGTFLIGCGFVLMLLPWWILPFFAVLFYMRFIRQIVKEEAFLTEMFGEKYKQYCERVPQLFPTLTLIRQIHWQQIFIPHEIFNTNEKNGWWTWPMLAFILETVQEYRVFGYTDIVKTLGIFLCTYIIFLLVLISSLLIDQLRHKS